MSGCRCEEEQFTVLSSQFRWFKVSVGRLASWVFGCLNGDKRAMRLAWVVRILSVRDRAWSGRQMFCLLPDWVRSMGCLLRTVLSHGECADSTKSIVLTAKTYLAHQAKTVCSVGR